MATTIKEAEERIGLARIGIKAAEASVAVLRERLAEEVARIMALGVGEGYIYGYHVDAKGAICTTGGHGVKLDAATAEYLLTDAARIIEERADRLYAEEEAIRRLLGLPMPGVAPA